MRLRLADAERVTLAESAKRLGRKGRTVLAFNGSLRRAKLRRALDRL